jgi:hypothetical protein
MTIYQNDWRRRLQVNQKSRERRNKLAHDIVKFMIAFFLGMAWQYYLTIK